MDFRNSTKAFQLYRRCLPVNGAERSLICDIDRFCYQLIPNSLYDLIIKYDGVPFYKIYDCLTDYEEMLNEYFSFLHEKQFLNLHDNAEEFPKLPLGFSQPLPISSAIIDIDSLSCHDFSKIFDQLSFMHCREVQLRFFSKFNIDTIGEIISLLDESPIRSIELVIPCFADTMLRVEGFCNRFPRITNLIIYGSPEFKTETVSGRLKISHIADKLNSARCCGVVYSELFSFSVAFWAESQHHNTCLNRKIAIDTEGNIKNCPSMSESFGNIKDTTLAEAMEKQGFKKYWNITKDQIAVCKDCEFRHICTDCRAYLEEPDDMYSKPLKCGYNPYTCEWGEWSTNPLKQKAIEYYGM